MKYRIVLWPASEIDDKYVAGYFPTEDAASEKLRYFLKLATEANVDTCGKVEEDK